MKNLVLVPLLNPTLQRQNLLLQRIAPLLVLPHVEDEGVNVVLEGVVMVNVALDEDVVDAVVVVHQEVDTRMKMVFTYKNYTRVN